ncbi:hypothetical protein ACFQ1I_13665 [Kitasatospora arboriphila]
MAGQGGNEKVLNLGPDSTGPFKLPQGASAVVLNVTVVNPSTAGFVAVEPNDKAKPTTSSVNFAAGQTVANLVTAPVGADGKVYLWTTTSDFDAIVDVAGYYSPTSPNKYAPKTPVRLLDTRSAGGPLGPGATKDVQITGQNDIPADATAAVVTLTAVQPTAGGFFIAHPTGATRPSTSNVNFTPGAIISNQAIVPIGAAARSVSSTPAATPTRSWTWSATTAPAPPSCSTRRARAVCWTPGRTAVRRSPTGRSRPSATCLPPRTPWW